MKKILFGLMIVLLIMGVSAGDFKIQHPAGTDLFVLNTTGDLSITGIYFGDGSGLTGISMTNSSYALTTWNKTYADTLYAGIEWDYNQSDGSTNSSYAYWTNGSLTSTYNATYAGYATGGVTISYQNITNLPTCNAGEHFFFDGSTLSCTADAGDFTNVAYYNNTQTWAEDQLFDKNLNVTGNINLMTNNSLIGGITSGVGMSIDSSGNIIFII